MKVWIVSAALLSSCCYLSLFSADAAVLWLTLRPSRPRAESGWVTGRTVVFVNG